MSEQVGAQYVVIGDDFRFGHGREGDLSLLQRAGKKFGYEVNSMNTVLQGSERISSTLVRATLATAISKKRRLCLVTNISLWGG